MNRRLRIAILGLLLFTLAQFYLIRPIIPEFYVMKLHYQVVYVIALYGIPLLAVLLAFLLSSLLSLIPFRGQEYKTKLFRIGGVFSVIFLLFLATINVGILYGKYVEGQDPFPLARFNGIQTTEQDLSNIRVGVFESEGLRFVRTEHEQIEEYQDGRTVSFKVEWISNAEYMLIRNDSTDLKMDTTFVKVTADYDDYYECYTKIGKYARFYQLHKK